MTALIEPRRDTSEAHVASAIRTRGTALPTARYLAAATGLDVVTTATMQVARAHDVVAVGAPRRFGCLWRRSRCGQTLEAALSPVLVAARAPRPFASCLVVMRATPGDVARLPGWLGAFASLASATAIEAPSFLFPGGHGPDLPSIYAGVSCGLDAATQAAAHVERACRARFGIARSVTSPGSVIDALRLAISEMGAFDLVCASRPLLPGFGLFLRECVDALGAAVLVLPDDHVVEPLAPAIAVIP